MKRKKVVTILNILLACAMVLHVSIAMYIHSQHFWSAPFYVEIVQAIYYLPPLLMVNIVNLILKRIGKISVKRHSQTKTITFR